jgi:hypothetical protein
VHHVSRQKKRDPSLSPRKDISYHVGRGGIPRATSHPQNAAKVRGFSRTVSAFTAETDCPLEGNGFELPVPREISSGFEASAGLRRVDRRRGGIIRAVVGLDTPIELLGRLSRKFEVGSRLGGETQASTNGAPRPKHR